MSRMILAVLVAVAACTGPEPAGRSGFRDTSRAISSAAMFDPARFAGVWHIVAAFGAEARCGALAETWVPDSAAQFHVTGTACGPNGARAFATDATVASFGRLSRPARGGRQELWVLWVDADYRVAVIGTPSGSFARILSRMPAVRPDLLQAARQVLDFNGYDISQLKPLG